MVCGQGIPHQESPSRLGLDQAGDNWVVGKLAVGDDRGQGTFAVALGKVQVCWVVYHD